MFFFFFKPDPKLIIQFHINSNSPSIYSTIFGIHGKKITVESFKYMGNIQLFTCNNFESN